MQVCLIPSKGQKERGSKKAREARSINKDGLESSVPLSSLLSSIPAAAVISPLLNSEVYLGEQGRR